MKFLRFSPFALFVLLITGTHAVSETPRKSEIVTEDEYYQVSVELSAKNGKTREIACLDGVPGTVKERGETLRFTPFSSKKRALKRRGRKSTKAFRIAKKLGKKGKVACDLSTQPYFDESGNTTDAGRVRLRIPAGIVANISRGEEVYQRECSTCHDEKTNRTYSVVSAAIDDPPMNKDLEVQEISDLVAYLNRTRS